MTAAPPSARAEATTRRTYNRPLDAGGTAFETWPQTIERAQVDHQRQLWEGAGGAPDPAEVGELRALGLSRAGLVAGRTLWLGGTGYGRSRPCSQFNCSALELSTVYDMVDAFWLLLNGAGVGAHPRAGTLQGYRRPMPLSIVPSTRPMDWKGDPENHETRPSADNDFTWTITVGDSAEAWAKALGKMLVPPHGRCDRLVVDGSNCRGPGGRLKGYGWVCNGFPPLAEALAGVHAILNRRAGDLLTVDDIGDVFNFCGQVLSTRRAAEILLIDEYHPDAAAFARRKHRYWEGNNQRRQSNNSLLFWRRPSVDELADLLRMNLVGGEPGFVNAEGALRKAPWFRAMNPCLTGDTLVAVADGRNAVPIAQLAEESGGVARFDVYSARPSLKGKARWVTEISSAVAVMTGVKPVGRLELSTGDSVRLTADHKVALADGTYRPAGECVGLEVEAFFTKSNGKGRRLVNTESNAHHKQCRMIWERANGPKPAGYEIDHVDPAGGDALDNLQLLTAEEHREKTSAERRGDANPIHRMRDPAAYRRRKAAQTFGAGNPRHSGLTDEYLIELATILHRDGLPVTLRAMRVLDARVPSSLSKNRFGGSIETLRRIAAGLEEYSPPVPPPAEPPPEPEPKARGRVFVTAYVPQGEEPVYDLIVEKNRNFYVITSGDEAGGYVASRGLLVHNCAEILLPSTGFCNLSSVDLPSFKQDYAALDRAVYLTARANYRQTCVDLRDPVLQPRWHQTNESLRLCGVSLTGIVNADWLSDYEIRRLRNTAVSGAYSMADELGLPRPKAVTTIKPEGTRTKVSGTTSLERGEGIHMPPGGHVMNWINFNHADPMVAALASAGYRVIPNPSDPANVLVRFPVDYSPTRGLTSLPAADGSRKLVNLEPATAQLARYLRWNRLWADHNVSATISFDEPEIPALARMIWDNWDSGYIATAFMRRIDPTLTAADLGHPYLPQEVFTEGAYREATAGLKPVDWDRAHTGWHEISDASGADCASGVCPVR